MIMTKPSTNQMSFLTQTGPNQRVVVDPEVTTGPNRMRAEVDAQRASTGVDEASHLITGATVEVDGVEANATRRQASARTPNYGTKSRY